MSLHKCRFCKSALNDTFIDLGTSPLSNSYLTLEDLNKQEVFYPLHAKICPQCFLIQLPEFAPPEKIFSDYAYFSSFSESWLQHSADYTEMIIRRFNLNDQSQVIEIASNDGYLLQYFKKKSIPVLGIEPAKNVAQVARDKGIPTECIFFGVEAANQLKQRGIFANLLVANNVIAHVPDLNDFVAGMKILLAENGLITVEFPHLLKLIKEKQFDTIYHEHFSYFSLLTAEKVFQKHGLSIFDVEEVAVHGGSLRIFVKHAADSSKPITIRVAQLLQEEKNHNLDDLKTYQGYAEKIKELKLNLLTFILQIKKAGKKIAGYGAPAKGNTLLNYCGITKDLLPFTVDRNPYKQNRFLPGTRIPIYDPQKITQEKPDFLLILPWNLKDEVMAQMSIIKKWNGQFVIPIPSLQII